MTVRYVGRVYDVVSYEARIAVKTPATVTELLLAVTDSQKEMLDAAPHGFNMRTSIEVGFGHAPPIMVVTSCELYECRSCGAYGHRSEDCPNN